MEKDEKLYSLRKTIDSIDTDIIKLIAKRMQTAQEIGEYKKKYKLPVFDSARWHDVLKNRIAEAKKRKIAAGVIEDIWDILHKEALEVEKGNST